MVLEPARAVAEMRRAARVDANQTAIVTALRQAGARVWIIGLPVDLLVGFRGKLTLMECKDGSKSPSRQAKTALQAKFFEDWADMPISLVDGPEAALRHLGVIHE
jgi:hypothetical protein